MTQFWFLVFDVEGSFVGFLSQEKTIPKNLILLQAIHDKYSQIPSISKWERLQIPYYYQCIFTILLSSRGDNAVNGTPFYTEISTE